MWLEKDDDVSTGSADVSVGSGEPGRSRGSRSKVGSDEPSRSRAQGWLESAPRLRVGSGEPLTSVGQRGSG